MGKQEKLVTKIIRGTSDTNITFSGICYLLRKFGFDERTQGDHHIFTKDGIEEILNLQPKGAKAKPYHVKQVRNIIIRYKLELEDEDEE